MEVEHKMVSLVIDENHQAELQKLEQEGFTLIAGIPPVAVYHLVRQKKVSLSEPPAPTNDGPQFKFAIDDSKIFVLPRNEKSDGSI